MLLALPFEARGLTRAEMREAANLDLIVRRGNRPLRKATSKDMNVLKTVSLGCMVVLVSLSACGTPSEPEIAETYVQAGDVTLHVRIAGNTGAENVLIGIHGGPGNSSDYMASLEELQNEEISVVTYDQRGAGQSSEPSEGFGLLNYVEDLEAVRKASGSEKVHLFGHSWGGIVAMRYATIHPDQVKSIILMGSGPPSADAVRAAQAKLGQRIAELQQRGYIDDPLPSTSEELIPALLPAYFSDPGFEMPDELANMSFDQQVSDQTFAALGEWDFKAEVGQLHHPVLMLWGEDDPFGLALAEATVSAFPGEVDFVVLGACGHYWHECPEEFFSEVRSFLEQVSMP
jgi:proline iminopeptidase